MSTTPNEPAPLTDKELAGIKRRAQYHERMKDPAKRERHRATARAAMARYNAKPGIRETNRARVEAWIQENPERAKRMQMRQFYKRWITQLEGELSEGALTSEEEALCSKRLRYAHERLEQFQEPEVD